jgi:hypothetical protein
MIFHLKAMEQQKPVWMVTVLLIKYSNHTDLKYETNSTGMANIGYKINDNNKIS